MMLLKLPKYKTSAISHLEKCFWLELGLDFFRFQTCNVVALEFSNKSYGLCEKSTNEIVREFRYMRVQIVNLRVE